MIESIPTNGFVIESYPYDQHDASQFESMFYPAVLALYLTESNILQKSTESIGRKDRNSLKSESPANVRNLYTESNPEVELVIPKHAKRMKEFSFEEAEIVCDKYAGKLVRIISAEVLNKDTFAFVNRVLRNCLEVYPNEPSDFSTIPDLCHEEYGTAAPKLAPRVSVVLRGESQIGTPPRTSLSCPSSGITKPFQMGTAHSGSESASSCFTMSQAASEVSPNSAETPESRKVSPIWSGNSLSSAVEEFGPAAEVHDGRGDETLDEAHSIKENEGCSAEDEELPYSANLDQKNGKKMSEVKKNLKPPKTRFFERDTLNEDIASSNSSDSENSNLKAPAGAKPISS
jgi:hypothetical protein